MFTCYALGMTIVMRTDAAKRMLPFSGNTGHDKWVTMRAAAMGKVCYIEEVLQSYRRHGKNVSGIFYHLSSKEEYYTWRVDTSCAVVRGAAGEISRPSPKGADSGIFTGEKEKKDGAAVEIPPDGACRGNV